MCEYNPRGNFDGHYACVSLFPFGQEYKLTYLVSAKMFNKVNVSAFYLACIYQLGDYPQD